MADIAIKTVVRGGVLDNIFAGYLDIKDEQDQEHRIRFHNSRIREILQAVAEVRELISEEMKKKGQGQDKPVPAKKVERFEFVIDQPAQVTVMIVRFEDQTSLPIQFHRQQIKGVIQALERQLGALGPGTAPTQH